MHTVNVEDFAFNPRNITITSGDLVEWLWVGTVAHTSTSDATTGPDSWDSGLLSQGGSYQSPVLSTGVHPYYCIPHGGPGGVGMSGTVTVQANCTNGQVSVGLSFTAAGGGFNGYEVLVDGNLAGSFAYDASGNNSISVQVAGDGQSHTLTVRDADNPNCLNVTTITTPDCNASACQLGLGTQEAGGCDANGEVPVELTVTDIGGGASGFEVLVDGAGAGTYNYSGTGSTLVTINVPGDGQSHNIEVRDLADAGCTVSANLTTTDCSLGCMITGLELTAADVGNPIIHIIEVRDFEFVPAQLEVSVGDIVRFEWTGVIAHTSTSDATTGADTWDSGLLNQGGVYEVTITTEGEHPYYCIPHGGPGGIGMSGVIEAFEPCDNGSALVEVTFTTTNGSGSGYNVFLDGVYLAGPIPYDNEMGVNSTLVSIPGDSAQHLLTVQDVDVSFCAATVQFTAPDCSGDCSIESLSVSFPESRRHLVEVLDFEFVPKELTVTAGDTVEFFWTGTIPHTTTSDATTGVDSWDSGLLGQGDDFELIINEPGRHNYYCIPHGGPGGIGMSGAITALPACQGDSVLASISFEPIGGGPTFGLLVDGAEIGQYDYQPGGSNTLEILLYGDGQSHELGILDMDNPNCSASLFVDVPQCAEPCAGFMAGFSVVYDGMDSLLVQFVDETPGVVHQWLWGFGDGATSNVQNPFHTYSQPGVYTICLLAQDTILGCNQAACEELQIGVTSAGEARTGSLPLWIFPNPAGQNTRQLMVAGLAPSGHSQLIHYVIYGLWGEKKTEGWARGGEVMNLPIDKHLPAGMYLLKLQSSSQTYTGKVAVQ